MRPIHVLVVDDSAVIRGLVVRALESDPTIVVSGTARHGEAALALLRREPVDVVILDVEMPIMDGLTALPHILKEFPHVRVIMASALTHAGADTTLEALALGAADYVAKPSTASAADSVSELSDVLVRKVKALGPADRAEVGPREAASIVKPPEVRAVVERTQPTNPRPVTWERRSNLPAEFVLIGTSTGGPNALSSLLAELPPTFEPPILIVQHMPPLFTPMLAARLQTIGQRPCAEAVDGGTIQRGHTYVAPGDFHLEIARVGGQLLTKLNQKPPEHFCRPSVNPLFRTGAEVLQHRVLAVMLTGMGDDGIEGTRDIVRAQGKVIAQDQASSVVWGMPGAVVREGLAQQVLPLHQIAAAIVASCRHEVSVR